jgi:uncharacterized membrane protein required for colicin V production
MNILDIIIIICFIPVLVSGYKKGFINQAISIVALITGAWTAYALGEQVGSLFMPMMEGSSNDPTLTAFLAGYATVFVAILVIFLLAGILIRKMFSLIIPETLDKLLGIVLSAVNGLFLFCALYVIFCFLNNAYMLADINNALFTESAIFPMIESTAGTLFPNISNLIL